MRYIGSKQNLLAFIERVATCHCSGARTFVDLFCGTAVVGRHFKSLNFNVTSNDLMAYAYTFARALVQNNGEPLFAGLGLNGNAPLDKAVEHLNSLSPVQGFVTSHYSPAGSDRMYLSPENAGRIDAIRMQLQVWRRTEAVTEDEFHILLAALLAAVPSVSNVSGTYGAYLKFWESRSKKRLLLQAPALMITPGTHRALNEDANVIAPALNCDILYLDPPYNRRQYASNYHLLESIAVWDYAAPLGVSGLPKRPERRSLYCTAQASEALGHIIRTSPARHILLSYNSEGIVSHEVLMEMLCKRGKVELFEEEYRRFRSDADGPTRNYKADSVVERLYLVSN
ncbi:MAG TPA: DNA adenine methylase [Armatimonadota bacterium]|jgi:adenine-specific DNA-methyltransferase